MYSQAPARSRIGQCTYKSRPPAPYLFSTLYNVKQFRIYRQNSTNTCRSDPTSKGLCKCTRLVFSYPLSLRELTDTYLVHPVHLAFVLINEASAEPSVQGGTPPSSNASLFSSVISRAGGDPVSPFVRLFVLLQFRSPIIQTAVKRSIQKLIVRLPAQSPPPEETSLSSAALKVLREAQNLQKTMHDSYIAQDHLLLALLKDASIAAVLKENGLNEATLKTAIEQARGNRRIESKTAEQGFDALQKYAVDLTALAEEGKIDPVIGRDNEIRRAIRILCRRYIARLLILS